MSETATVNQTTLKIVKDDLTAMDVEAFVFYANKELELGSGYGNAIATRGGPDIKEELEKLKPAEPQSAVVTGAGRLKAKHIIHAVGPVFREENTEEKLEKTIVNTIKAAREKGINQLAFPIMGAGFYGINYDTAIKIMFDTIKRQLNENTTLKEIIFCGNDNREYRLLKQQFDIFNKREN